MTKQEHTLTTIMEECVEVSKECNNVAQRASKALRFGVKDIQREQLLTNEERLVTEFNDLLGAIEYLFKRPIHELIDRDMIEAKKAKIEKYLNYSLQCGTLENC